MTIDQIPPGLILIAGGLAMPLVSQWWRSALVLALPLATLWLVWQLPDGTGLTAPFLGYELEIVKTDKLARLFATVFSIMAFAGGLFAFRQARPLELSAAFIYAGSAIGVIFAGDLITLFIFWEFMALSSTLVIWSANIERARKAGFRYLLMHLLGGVLLMAGIIDYIAATNTVSFGAAPIYETLGMGRPGTWLILAGFLINAGAAPLSAWLPDAYPESSPSGMVFLSAFTTKTAVFVLLRGYPGFDILIWIGLAMVFYGIIYALLENDMRRILAYSIINQVGFMVTGIGIGSEMALNGAASHAFAHIIYKALLLMSAGSVMHMTGKRKCTDLGGLFRTMPVTTICGIIGALAISSFPLTSGFVTKSMISQGAIEQNLAIVWFLLAAASAGVFLHAGIKFPWFVFFQKDSGLRPSDPPWNMRAAMIFLAFVSIFIGVWPTLFYELLPFTVTYNPYGGAKVLGTLQLLLFSGLAFFVLLPMMKRTLTISLDIDWFWRRLGSALVREIALQGGKTQRRIANRVQHRLLRLRRTVFYFSGPKGILARTWETGSATLVIIALLAVYLITYYL